MKNRIIYWGGKENTMIPRMGSCGDGVEVEAAGGGGSGRAGGTGAGTGGGPQKPSAKISVPDGLSLFDKLKGLLPKLAIGALALATVAGVAMMVRKNREPDSEPPVDDDTGDGRDLWNC